MEELVPTAVQKSRKLRSLVLTEETAVNSSNLPMSGPTQDALRMQLDDSTSGPSFKPAAYRFLPVEDDATPLTFVSTPAKEVGLERFGRKSGSSTKLLFSGSACCGMMSCWAWTRWTPNRSVYALFS